MSANNQLVIAPLPEDLSKFAVWYDGCVDNPFDFSKEPAGVFDTLEEAVLKASEMDDGYIEYGLRVISRNKVSRYEKKVWESFPDYEYLDVIPRLSEVKPS